MRGFNDAAFANVFALALDASNPGRKLNRWRVGDVDWQRERLNHSGPVYALHAEIHTVTHTAAPKWRLLYVIESWWDGSGTTLRDQRWGRLTEGGKSEALAWFRGRAG